jgi:outer membrane receptor protein involved in Fe transport
MVYASAAEGFRDGGINRPVPIPLCSQDLSAPGLTQAPPSYKADSLWSYELGAKSRALSNALSVSGSLFDIRWNNIQTDIILPTCTFDIKDNIGRAENRGVELEMTARASSDLKLTASGNFTDARIRFRLLWLAAALPTYRSRHVPMCWCSKLNCWSRRSKSRARSRRICGSVQTVPTPISPSN